MRERTYNSAIIQSEMDAKRNRTRNMVLSAAAFAVTNIATRKIANHVAEKAAQKDSDTFADIIVHR